MAEDAGKLQQLEKGISTLDFSITHIEQEESPKYKDIILKLNGNPQEEKFYNLKINYHPLTANIENYEDKNSDEAEHLKFFNELWKSSKSNAEIRNKLLVDNSWYNGISNTVIKSAIETVVKKVYPDVTTVE